MHAMKSHDAIQTRRSELKFEIEEPLATSIRGYLGSRLRPDPNSTPSGYPVCSVYLDSPDGMLYRQTNDGIRNRYKLRVRVYDNHPDHPAFLEIKRRDGSAVKKQRCKVNRRVATELLAGRQIPIAQAGLGQHAVASQKERKAYQDFCRLRDSIGAVGTTYVLYRREAYVSPQQCDWRATFDRNLVASKYELESELVIPQKVVAAAKPDEVVFELKFTNRFPNWMRELVRTFNLVSGPFPKYVTCRSKIAPPAKSSEFMHEASARQFQRSHSANRSGAAAMQRMNGTG